MYTYTFKFKTHKSIFLKLYIARLGDSTLVGRFTHRTQRVIQQYIIERKYLRSAVGLEALQRREDYYVFPAYLEAQIGSLSKITA
jgi:hypothetical protein